MASKVPLTPKDRGEARQSPLVGWVVLGGDALAEVNNETTEVFEMPDKYRLTKIMVEVVEAFNSGASLQVGNSDDPDAFLVVDLTTVGFSKGAYVDMGHLGTYDGQSIVLVPAGVDGSSGLLTVTLKYNVEGRSHSTQG